MTTKPSDFVFNSIYKGALKAGVEEHVAHRHAVMGADDYAKNRFKKVIELIDDRIKQAKKNSK